MDWVVSPDERCYPRTEKPYGLSAADLKFLHSLPQVRNRNFKSMRH